MTCSECGGARVQGEHCLAHLTESEFDAEISRLRDGGTLDARNVTLSAERLQALLDQLRPNKDSGPQLPRAVFSGAEFSDFIDAESSDFGFGFVGAEFSDFADFSDAKFSDFADFSDAKFSGIAVFIGAEFSDGTNFIDAKFSRSADFSFAKFSDFAQFIGAEFSDGTDFIGAEFSDGADFIGTKFSGNAANAKFSRNADFRGAKFSEGADFRGAEFSRNLEFARAAFERHVTIGPLVVSSALVFDDAEFQQDVALNASAFDLRCRRTRFRGRADLNVLWAEIALDNATFAERSRLAGAAKFAGELDETSAQRGRGKRRLMPTSVRG